MNPIEKGEQIITGLSWGMKLPDSQEAFNRRVKSKGAYLMASCEGEELLIVPIFKIPMAPIFTADKQQWLTVEFPIERTRFDIPAWVELRYQYGVKK